jgi:hypothetical protein
MGYRNEEHEFVAINGQELHSRTCIHSAVRSQTRNAAEHRGKTVHRTSRLSGLVFPRFHYSSPPLNISTPSSFLALMHPMYIYLIMFLQLRKKKKILSLLLNAYPHKFVSILFSTFILVLMAVGRS